MTMRFLWEKHPARAVVGVWLLSRLALFFLVTQGAARLFVPSPKLHRWEGVPSPALSPWTLFDSQYFLDIAQAGYNPLRSAFFPLYPLLMRVFAGPGASQNTLALVGIVLSNAAFLGALWLLYLLTRDEWGEIVAERAVWLQAFFPAAAFSAAVYSESLFLVLSLGLFWFARQKKWGLCALSGALAGFTRNSGPVLFLALLLDRPKEPLTPSEKWARARCALCPLAGFVAFRVALLIGGNGEGLLVSQRHFGRGLSFPLVPIALDALRLWREPLFLFDFANWPPMVACVLTFALIWHFRREFSAGKLLFLGAVLLLDLTFAWHTEPHIRSTLRFLLATFPFVQLLALWSGRALTSPRAATYARLAYAVMFLLESFQFGQRRFLG